VCFFGSPCVSWFILAFLCLTKAYHARESSVIWWNNTECHPTISVKPLSETHRTFLYPVSWFQSFFINHKTPSRNGRSTHIKTPLNNSSSQGCTNNNNNKWSNNIDNSRGRIAGIVSRGKVNVTGQLGGMQSAAAVALMPLSIFCCGQRSSTSQCFLTDRATSENCFFP